MYTRVSLNIVAILFIVGLTAYVHHVVSEITEIFASVRVSEAKFFTSLLRENWDGIKTIPEEKKKILLENPDPALTATDLQVMKTLILIMFYFFMAGAIADRLIALYRLRKNSRSNPVAT